tara:strand:+ start:258 stop:1316 length:1059 start_codon:yes stop_codon:yes gene_type:complete
MSTLKVDGIRSNSATSDAITLANDGTCTAKLKSIAGGQLAGFRNLVINGNMKVHQRAQSVTGVTNGYRTADRFFLRRSAAGTTFNSSVANGVLTVNNPSASTAFDVRYGIEWDDAFYGKTMTISFNATAAVGSVDFSVGVVDGTIGATTASVAAHLTGTTTDVADITVSPVSGTKYEITVDIPADADVSFTPDMLRLGFGTVSADASQSFTLSNVQCEFGTVATEFEYRSLQDTYKQCLRYAYVINAGDTDYVPNNYAYAYTDTVVRGVFYLPQPMRTYPSYTGNAIDVNFYANNNSAYFHFDDISGYIGDTTNDFPDTFAFTVTTSSISGGQGGFLLSRQAGGQIIFDAEL